MFNYKFTTMEFKLMDLTVLNVSSLLTSTDKNGKPRSYYLINAVTENGKKVVIPRNEKAFAIDLKNSGMDEFTFKPQHLIKSSITGLFAPVNEHDKITDKLGNVITGEDGSELEYSYSGLVPEDFITFELSQKRINAEQYAANLAANG